MKNLSIGKIAAALAFASLFHAAPIHAATGTWINLSGSGTWSDGANWTPSVADGADSFADFNTLDITGTNSVFLDTARAIGNLIFGDIDPVTTPGSWVVTNGGIPGNVLTLQTTSGTPTVTTNVNAVLDLLLAGNNGLTKSGSAALTLTQANTYSGGTTITSGSLIVSAGSSLGSGGLTFSSIVGNSRVDLNASQALSFISSPTFSGNTLAIGAGTILSLGQDSTFGGVLASTGTISKVGNTTLTLTNTNAQFTGTINIVGGGLTLDMSGANFTAASQLSLPGGATVSISGGTLLTKINAVGTVQETIRLIVNPGASTFTNQRNGGRIVNNFSFAARSAGGTGNITLLTSGNGNEWRMPTSASVTGLGGSLVPWLTVANTTWFVPAGGSASGSAYTAFIASTATSLGVSATNVNVVTNVALPVGTSTTTTTIRFNDAAASRTITVGASDTLSISAGAILVTSTVGVNSTLITGGTLTGGSPGSGSAPDLIVFQYNTASPFTIGSIIADGTAATALTKSGSGTLVLSNTANTYSGKTFLNAGILRVADDGSLGAVPVSPLADSLTFFGGTLQLTGTTVINANRGITLNTSGVIDTFGTSGTYGGVISGLGTFIKTGLGTLTLAGSNNYTGGTTINGGVLRVKSNLGAGPVFVGATATLSGSSIIPGAVTLAAGGVAGAGGHIAPGDNGVGTITVGSILLSANSVLDLEFNGSANDQVLVAGFGGLTINGGGFNLFTEGTTNKFLTTGTYSLMAFTGPIGGVGVGAFNTSSILNPQAGLTYSFNTSGSFITLTIGGTVAVSGTWVGPTNSWAVASNWSGNLVPNSSGATADFLGAAPTSVTLDGDKTVGTLEFGGTNAYTVSSGTGGSIVIVNESFTAQINDLSGSHTIAAPISLSASNTTINIVNANDTLTISGNVSGTGSALIKTGPGSLTLSGSNSYAAGTSLGSGTTQITNSASFGTGPVTISGTSTIHAGAAGISLPNNTVINSGVSAIFDMPGTTLTLTGTISGPGGLIKTGTDGQLVLAANNSYGATTITGGTLQVGAGGTSGSLGTGTVSNASVLVFNRADTLTQSGAISGAGALIQAGLGTTILAGANTLSGTTTITSGTLELANQLALQNSTLLANNGGGTLSFGTLTAATLGGLTGSQSIALINTSGSAVALGVGGNTESLTYAGSLSGPGSLLKSGTSVFTLTGTQTYTGLTTGSNAGILELAPGAVLGSATNVITMINNAVLRINGATVTADTLNLQGLGSNALGGGRLIVEAGSVVNFTNTRINGSNQTNTASSTATINGGLVNLGAYSSDRDGSTSANPNVGLIVNGGTVTATSISLSTGPSWSNMTVNGGSLTIGGTGSTNAFLVGNGSSSARGGNLTVTSGTLTYLGLDGMILNNTSTANDIGQATFSGGTSFLTGIILNNPAVTSGIASLTVSGGTVFIGSSGIQKNIAGTASSSVIFSSGTVGALSSWSSNMTASLDAPGVTFHAADQAGVPHDILLSGTLFGAGNVKKTGGGVLTLSGSNNLTGPVDVLSGELRAIGSVGALNVSPGATLSTGSNPGSLATASDFTLQAGGNLVLKLGGTAAGTGHDQIITTGTINLAGSATISLFAGFTPTADEVFYFLLNDDVDGINGTFSSINGFTAAEGDTIFVDGFGFKVTYAADGDANPFFVGNDFALSAVPEPGTWAMLVGGTGLLLGMRRARRRKKGR